MKKDVDDYLQEGIYGAKETKPAERKRFLGSLRERIVFALTKGQVMRKKGLAELEAELKKHPDAKLLLNGNISYRFLKEYRLLADKYGVHSTSISNREAETDIGAVLTYDHAIDKEQIFLAEKEETKEGNKSEAASITHFLKKIFTGK
ncbi:YueI family protein [Thalassobacillus sp. B23F22_16]|uniref:YueI family protein n=1 Tax=Thalassobacillus sp. B23F22_16 TaxID=3459513 RepID=UPI00373F2D87